VPANSAPPAEFKDLVVFGDSLSDTGNAGRFSNGPVWVEVIADRIDVDLQPSRLGGTNYAVGGARSHGRPTDLRGQLQAYLESAHSRSISETLLVIFGGANDLLAAGCANAGERAARTAAAAIAATVSDLAAAGARTILVPNLPDIGAAPLVRVQGAACADRARRLSRTFNKALEQKLDAAAQRYRTRIVRLDAFALSQQLLAEPGEAGFDDVDTPCAGASCERALFWDPLHPTTRAHARLAAAALRALGIPETD
jgi:outer membrane lipase/esterase